MPRKEILDRIQKYIQPFRITEAEGFQLKNYDPGDTWRRPNSFNKVASGSHKSRTCFTPRIAGRCCSSSRR